MHFPLLQAEANSTIAGAAWGCFNKAGRSTQGTRGLSAASQPCAWHRSPQESATPSHRTHSQTQNSVKGSCSTDKYPANILRSIPSLFLTKGNCSKRLASFFIPRALTKLKKSPNIKDTTNVAASIAAGMAAHTNTPTIITPQQTGKTTTPRGNEERGNEKHVQGGQRRIRQCDGTRLLGPQHWLSLESVTQIRTRPLFQSVRHCSLLYAKDLTQHE